MDFLGVGPLEIFFILIIALIVLGPKDMVKAGRTLGKLMRKIVTSPTWHAVQDTSRNLRNLPYKLMRESGIDEVQEEVKSELKDVDKASKELSDGLRKDIVKTNAEIDLSSWTSMPAPTILPPEQKFAETQGEDNPAETPVEASDNTEDTTSHA